MPRRINFRVLLLFEFLENITCPSGKLKTEFTSPIAKSTSPGLSDTTSFARCYSETKLEFILRLYYWSLVSFFVDRISRMYYNLMCLWVCFYAAPVEDDSNLGGLNLGGYEKHQQKLRQERKEEYRKYLAEVLYHDYSQVERSHNPYFCTIY